MVTGLVPHVGGLMAARMGDPTVHGGVIVMGAPTVMIGVSGQGGAMMAAAQNGAPFVQKCNT
jgi:hypothetical protein